MFKLFKNLKSSAFTVIAIIMLLCIQATADLALPDYTSRIVNVGIQAGGIENVAPEDLPRVRQEYIEQGIDLKPLKSHLFPLLVNIQQP